MVDICMVCAIYNTRGGRSPTVLGLLEERSEIINIFSLLLFAMKYKVRTIEGRLQSPRAIRGLQYVHM